MDYSSWKFQYVVVKSLLSFIKIPLKKFLDLPYNTFMLRKRRVVQRSIYTHYNRTVSPLLLGAARWPIFLNHRTLFVFTLPLNWMDTRGKARNRVKNYHFLDKNVNLKRNSKHTKLMFRIFIYHKYFYLQKFFYIFFVMEFKFISFFHFRFLFIHKKKITTRKK